MSKPHLLVRLITKVRSVTHRALGLTRLMRVRKQLPIGDARHFAIICIYEKDRRRDLEALLRTLKQAGFYCVVSSTNGAGKAYRDLADAEIVGGTYGRDFTTYKTGLNFLKRNSKPRANSTVAFFNDSVWYFERYQQTMVDRLLAATASRKLFAGGMTVDEVPHVSGWLFAVPFDEDWRDDLDALFSPHFASDDRGYHIRYGEHRILTEMRHAEGLELMAPTGSHPAVAACYVALAEGRECFYLKADAQIRTDARFNHLERFFEVNADPVERMIAFQWLVRRSSQLYRDRPRLLQMIEYRKRHFGRDWLETRSSGAAHAHFGETRGISGEDHDRAALHRQVGEAAGRDGTRAFDDGASLADGRNLDHGTGLANGEAVARLRHEAGAQWNAVGRRAVG